MTAQPSGIAARLAAAEPQASFGADWVESAPAHEIVLRPWVYRAGLAAGRLRRAIRGER